MERHFEADLRNIKRQILEMGGAVESMIDDATRSLVDRDREAITRVLTKEREVNHLQNAVDEACLRVIALQHPMASDLRFLAAVLKMTADLERMGDLTVNITQAARKLMNEPLVKPYIDLPRMAKLATNMVHQCLDALVQKDEEMGYQVLVADDEVDSLKHQVFRELLTYMMSDPSKIPSCLQLILISRHYERIADHATNIAEEVIYIVSGRDIRHHQEELANGHEVHAPADDTQDSRD